MAALLRPDETRPRVQWNENAFCVLRLPDDQLPPPEAPWTVVAQPDQNAIVIRGTPEKVARLRATALAIDTGYRPLPPR
jgi:hypothetical protein